MHPAKHRRVSLTRLYLQMEYLSRPITSRAPQCMLSKKIYQNCKLMSRLQDHLTHRLDLPHCCMKSVQRHPISQKKYPKFGCKFLKKGNTNSVLGFTHQIQSSIIKIATKICRPNLSPGDIPSLRLSFCQSSNKPINPNKTKVIIHIHRRGLSRFPHKSRLANTLPKINNPPIVGIFCLACCCVCGVSSRGLEANNCCARRINALPNVNDNPKLVNKAHIARTEI